MAWFRRKNEIDDAIEAGQLDRAAELTRRLGDSKATQAHRRQLTEALIRRATDATKTKELSTAWQALSQAASFADTRQNELVTHQTRQLQELTIDTADAKLQAGQSQQAADLVQLLIDRDLSNQHTDRISSATQLLIATDDLIASGKLEDAIASLESVKRLYPELPGLQERIASQQERKPQLDSLTQSLQSAALSCKWNDVCDLCNQILELAPQHEVASGAKRHAMQRVKRRTSVGSRLTNVPESPKQNEDLVINPTPAEGGVGFAGNLNLDDTAGHLSSGASTSVASAKNGSNHSASTSDQDSKNVSQASSFLIWVDGVGGYLVCTKPVNFIGQAVGGSSVSIPMQADVRQRHARLETIEGQHLIQPLGVVAIDGREVPVDESIAIKSGQQVSLGGVKLAYRQDHPLSKSARLDFVSRHRTLPWSDGVILAGQSIILGPNPNNHIFCPSWNGDLVLFRRNDKWFAKCKLEFCVDDHAMSNESEIQFDSRLFCENFSLKLEPVFLDS